MTLKERLECSKRVNKDNEKQIFKLKDKLAKANILLLERVQELQKLNAEERRLTNFNCKIQLENIQLTAQRDAVIAALADCQRRNKILRDKLRPCAHGCGSGINEDTDTTGMPFTDRAAEVL